MLNPTPIYTEKVYATERQFNSRVFYTQNGVTTEYGDDKIVRANLIEEMSILNESMPSDELNITMNNEDGDFDFLNLQNMQEILASKPTLRWELGLTTSEEPLEIEWFPMGTYTLIEYKNESGSMMVNMVARDVFDNLSNMNYENFSNDTLYNLAVDILTVAGITNYEIHSSLNNLTGQFLERLDCRSALQHIGIASMSAVYEDRSGKFQIKPFDALDQSSNYLRYSGSGLMFSGSPFAYPLLSTGGGMKYIDFDQMYDPPEITLEKSLYQLVIDVHDYTLYPDDPGNPESTMSMKEPIPVAFTNSAINGQNGASFSIENPLIHDVDQAQKVADWFFREYNLNAIYRANWRQNPILETADVILMEDSFEAQKQTRIFRQEFIYEGYLQGITESRGGI
jgi:hypothetical protein